MLVVPGGGIMILKGMVWGEFEFMVEIMRVLGELIFFGPVM